MKRRYRTESPIFVILCVLCFQRQSFFTFIVHISSSPASNKLDSIEENEILRVCKLITEICLGIFCGTCTVSATLARFQTSSCFFFCFSFFFFFFFFFFVTLRKGCIRAYIRKRRLESEDLPEFPKLDFFPSLLAKTSDSDFIPVSDLLLTSEMSLSINPIFILFLLFTYLRNCLLFLSLPISRSEPLDKSWIFFECLLENLPRDL